MRNRLIVAMLTLFATLSLSAAAEAPTPLALPALDALLPAGEQCQLGTLDGALPGLTLPSAAAAPGPEASCSNFCCTSNIQCTQRCLDAAACVGSGSCKRCIYL
jgi:hypothetical protein